MEVLMWPGRGEPNRVPFIREPCNCASDRAITPPDTAAVFSGSDEHGNGFTVFLTLDDIKELERQAKNAITPRHRSTR